MSVFAPALAIATPDLALQRGQFIEAEQALKGGNLAKFEKLKAKLQDYPLYPYLTYAHLTRHLSSAKKEEIDRFLAEHGDSLLGDKLRKDWLQSLAMRQRWQDYLGYYTPLPDVETQCEYRRALLSASNSTQAFEDLDRLWLTEHKQPAACDPLFSAWQRAGGLTRDKVWQRYQMAMDARQTTAARHLERYLDGKDKHLAALWQQVDQNPKLIFSSRELKNDEPIQRAIVLHGIARIARKDVLKAAQIWKSIQSQLSFTEEEQAVIESKLTTALALKNVYRPPEELVSLNPELANQKAREWRIRIALASEEWDTALIWLNHLDEKDRDSLQWQYWRARALEIQGSPRAKEIYEDLAQVRNYYGFMAADRLGTAYQLNDQPLIPPETDLASMQRNPGIMRARELYLIGRTSDARREWNHTIRAMSDAQAAIAAKLAQQWGWHDRAIMTVEHSSSNNDLALRFPIPYDTQVLNEAEKRNIDPAWAFAMMRQESVFMADARSPVGALGLMQLMPNTGRLVARSLNSRWSSPKSLLDANTNIRFGITYLRSVLDSFNDNPVLATAAYNAGGDRVKRWLPYNRAMPADVWVETVPFSETRNYLQNVFAYTVVYDYRLGHNTPTPLTLRMPPILGHGTSSLQHTSSLIGVPGT